MSLSKKNIAIFTKTKYRMLPNQFLQKNKNIC